MSNDFPPVPFDAPLAAKQTPSLRRPNESGVERWIAWLRVELDATLELDDGELECRHDFIQWLFPIDAPSPYNPDAPVIGRDALREAVEADPFVRAALGRSWARMLAFYGLAVGGGRIDWLGRRLAWAKAVGHNDRRISRMLKCMQSAGLSEDAVMLMDFLGREFGSEPRRANALSWWRHQVS